MRTRRHEPDRAGPRGGRLPDGRLGDDAGATLDFGDQPARVYVGNIELTSDDDFALSNNRKTVTLSAEFLNKRTAGNTYTIKVLTYSGDYASCTFQILTTGQASSSPRTGDESNLGLWAAFLLLSGTAVVVLLPKLRKHEEI